MRVLILLCTLLLAACSGAGTDIARTGPWTMSAAESRLSFMSIKNGSAIEVHSFKSMAGIVTNTSALIDIDLDTVETGINIRNERMREHLFETGQNPELQIETLIMLDDFERLELGARMIVTLPVSVKMHGFNINYDLEMVVTRLNVNKVMVQNAAPLIVDASDFGMEAGIEKLRALANLTSITASVPVSFSLVFER